jgi:hypothetical protein
MRAWRAAARHYHSLFLILYQKLYQGVPESDDTSEIASVRAAARDALPLDLFTWETFQWAMAVVLTRQNRLPTRPGNAAEGELALMPVFDMINHEAGEITTDFLWGAGADVAAEESVASAEGKAAGANHDGSESACATPSEPDAGEGFLVMYAKRPFKSGEQLRMSYGPRSSADFLQASGFVPEGGSGAGEVVMLPLQLVLNSGDPLVGLKQRLLARMGIVTVDAARRDGTEEPADGGSATHLSYLLPLLPPVDATSEAQAVLSSQAPVDSRLRVFLQTATANKERLAVMMRRVLASDTASTRAGDDVDDSSVGPAALAMLASACRAVMETYPESTRTIERTRAALAVAEESKISGENNAAFRSRMIIRLRLREQEIVLSALDAAERLLSNIEIGCAGITIDDAD